MMLAELIGKVTRCLAISLLPLLTTGCFTSCLVDWATEPTPVKSHVESVEAASVSSRVLALTVIDLAEDGEARRRDFWWVPASPSSPHEEVARVASLATTSAFRRGPPTLIASEHRLPLQPTRTPVAIVVPGVAPTVPSA